MSCPCGAIILADTEDWDTPLCYECWSTRVDGHTHVMPDYGPKHFENKDCWCSPKLDYKDSENNNEVWAHNDSRLNTTN